MQYSNDVKAFLLELYKRFSLQSPKFFQVIQFIGMTAALITGIPSFIDWAGSQIGHPIVLPVFLQVLESSSIFWAGVITKIIAKLPVNNVNTVIRNTDMMPFTEKKKSQGVDVSEIKTEQIVSTK